MEAIRLRQTPVQGRLTIDLPKSMADAPCEIIVFHAQQIPDAQQSSPIKRRPSPRLAGTVLADDLGTSSASDDDWDALK